MPFLPRATTISRSFLAITSYVISVGSVDSSLSFFFSCRLLMRSKPSSSPSPVAAAPPSSSSSEDSPPSSAARRTQGSRGSPVQ